MHILFHVIPTKCSSCTLLGHIIVTCALISVLASQGPYLNTFDPELSKNSCHFSAGLLVCGGMSNDLNQEGVIVWGDDTSSVG